MKIGFDISQTGSKKAGCGFYADSLINNALSTDKKNEYTLLTNFGNFYHDRLMALRYPYKDKKICYGPRIISKRAAIKYWNSKEGYNLLNKFDIIHANNYWCPPWEIKSKLIYTLYDISVIENPEWSRSKNNEGCRAGLVNASKYARYIVAISNATKQAFLSQFPNTNEKNIFVIYPASRFGGNKKGENLARPKNKIFRNENPFLLSVGTIEPRKNQAFLLRVYDQFRNQNQGVIPLIFVGKIGWLADNFMQEIKKSKWRADIHLLGYVDESELCWLYQNCLINLYPSFYEGFGLPVLEGLKEGAATICSNTTSMPEIVGDCGIMVSPTDKEGWVDAIELLVKNKLNRLELKKRSVLRAEKFSWERSTNQILELYDSLRN
jgi:glycosyltransferase involved in cell wall biosynthesis